MKLFNFDGESEKLRERRKEADRVFEELDYPAGIRTPGRTWTRFPRDFEEKIKGELDAVNPRIETSGEVEVFTGAEAVEKADGKLLDAVKFDENRMHALHTCNMNSLIYIEGIGEGEVEIEYDEEVPVFTNLLVDAGESSELTVKEYFEGSSFLQSSIAEFYVGENSKVVYGSLDSSTGKSYSVKKAVVSKHGEIEWLNSVFGPELAKHRIETVLDGENSSTDMTSAFYPTQDQHHDVSLQVRHKAPKTSCDMNTRGVVDDEARSVYEGLQKVAQKAPDTSSFQHENTLVLSENAEADASPKLMIENNDVEATHAAAAGRVDEEKLHYLKSRGLSEDEARKLVVKGFFEPIMDKIPLEGMKEELRQKVLEKIEKQQI